MLTIRAMSDGRGYSSRHLENRDYYAEGERATGQWQGRAAELLELRGEVKTTDFERLCQGLDPRTGRFLRQRHSADRVSSDGTTQSRGRHLYDFTFSAPKSVSIMAVLGEDDRLIEAHSTAVAEALWELERFAAGRVRQSGANDDRETGNLAIAVYHHDTSRELDPQLHTHAVAANLTYDGKEGRWEALLASGINGRRAYLTEVYRNSLARHVRLLGYEVENHRDPRGSDCGFEIRGVPDELLTRFSQRSRQRDVAIDKFVADKGRRPTDNEIAVLVRESRAGKLIEISADELRARQRSRLTREEAQTLAELRPVENGCAIPHLGVGSSPGGCEAADPSERQGRVTKTRGEKTMTRLPQYQKGYVSYPIKTRKGSVYRIRYRLSMPDGRCVHKTETLLGLKGKKEALAILDDRIRNIRVVSAASGGSKQPPELTVQEFIDTYWKQHHQRQNTKPGTVCGYLSVLDHHVSEVLKKMRMAEVTPTHIMEIVQEKEDAGLKPNTIRNILGVVRGIFTLAVELEVVERSPVRRVHFPDRPKPKKNRVVWSPQQVLNIIMAAPREFKAIFALLAFCATRINEVLALQWKHVDFERQRVLIEQSLFRGQIVSTKTAEAGESYMPLGSVGLAFLRHHQEIREHHRQPTDFVFCKRDGRPLDDDVLRLHVLYPILDRLGIPRVPYESGFPCFRHTAGSLVNAETGNLKLVQGLLRHAQLSTTADTYVQNLPESDREVARILESKILESCSQLFPIWGMSVFTRRLTTSCNIMRLRDLGLEVGGTPGAIRTRDLRFRRPTL